MSFRVSSETLRRLVSDGKFLILDVNFDVVYALIDWILENRPEKTSFIVPINSSGGMPSAVVYFASFLRTLPEDVKFSGVAFGQCGSAALALLQCFQERIAVESCGFFIHNLQTKIRVDCRNPDKQAIDAEIEQSRVIEDELVRLQCKRTGITKEKWRELAEAGERLEGRAILASQAFALGLVDKVVERYPIF
jgi:ATP-dependent protease ClpP protease subunit